MKRLGLLILGILVIAGWAFAETNRDTINFAMSGYIKALKSDNEGLRTSALFQISKLKAKYPQTDLSPYVKELEKVSRTDANPIVRTQANLALLVLKNPKLASDVPAGWFVDPAKYFTQVYEQVYHTYSAEK